MRVLVVGGSRGAPDGAGAALRDLGCAVQEAELFGEVDEERLLRRPPALVVLDVGGRPDVAASEIARLRAADALAETPVLVCVDARAANAIDFGAGFDDFVLAPLTGVELYARCRQIEWRQSDFAAEERMKAGDLVVDLAAHEVHERGRAVKLTNREFSLLCYFLRSRGRAVSRDLILRRVWGADYEGGTRTVDIHVRRLRAKLAAAERGIETLHRVGYRFREPT